MPNGFAMDSAFVATRARVRMRTRRMAMWAGQTRCRPRGHHAQAR